MIYQIIPKEEFDRLLNSDIPKYSKFELFAMMCRYNTFNAVKKAGSGHLGSSFSAMDIIVYLYLDELNTVSAGFKNDSRDIYFSSKGHDVPGLYSLFYAFDVIDIDMLMSLRRIGGLDGHPDARQQGIEANSGSLGMGISKAKGMAWAKNYLGNGGRVFVLTGDGEFQEGQIWESLQSTAHQRINNITAIVDRNKFQTDRLVDEVNSIENLEKKAFDFGWHVLRCNGHSYEELERTFKHLKEIKNKPKLIIADTIKGKGLSFLEESYKTDKGTVMYKWHSGAPDDETFIKGLEEFKSNIEKKAELLKIEKIKFIEYNAGNQMKSNVSKEYVTAAYGEELCRLAEIRKDIVVLDADLSNDCKLRDFENRFPDRFIENGIAEQDMVSMAGGLARMGFLPIVNTFASFLSARANEQIYNNACENTKIVYACHFSGLIPAGPGKSHQSVRDISLFGALPNCTIVQPCNALETKLLLDWCINEAKENCSVRLVIGPSPREITLPYTYKLRFGQGCNLTQGNDAVLFAYGPVMLNEALSASEILKDYGFGLKVINMPWLNRIDENWLESEVYYYRNIFVLEDHSVTGGLGDNLLNSVIKIIDMGGKKFRKFGLVEYPECGTPSEVLKYHKLDAISLARRISGIDLTDKSLESRFTEDAPQ